jgi:Flp pilus assembly protein TadG
MSILSRFRSNQSGNVALMFALTLIPLVIAMGAAVDYSVAIRQRSKLQGVLDSALLAGVNAARDALDAGNNWNSARTAGQTMAANFFTANLDKNTSGTLSASFRQDGVGISATGTITGGIKTNIMSVAGIKQIPISASSSVSTSSNQYLDVYLLVDISASMLLPSTTTGITQMIQGTGCALACHDAPGSDSYAFALAHNIQLRYQVVNAGVAQLLAYIQSQPMLQQHTRVGLWSLDQNLTMLAAPTSTYSNITTNFPQPAVATTDAAAATPFDSLVANFIAAVGQGGDGTRSNPRKMAIIATDGVNDPTRGWTTDVSLRPQVRVFDTGFCAQFQSNNVTLGIINTPYYPMPWDWGYAATLGQPGSQGGATRVDDIPIALSNCAGKYFVVAADVTAITNSFTNLFKSALGTRISR